MYKGLFIITGLLNVLTQGKALAAGEWIVVTNEKEEFRGLVKRGDLPSDHNDIENIKSFEKQKDGMYNGQTINNKKEGYGIMIYEGIGDVRYEGDFKNDKRDGVGKCTCYSNFDEGVYGGGWKNDKKEGQGILVLFDASTRKIISSYTGDWKNDKKEGYGEFKDSNYKYEGYFKNDEREGRGILWWTYGGFCSGEFKNGDIIHGTRTFLDVRYGKGVYYGNFRYWARQGRGMMMYSNGDIYIGEWNKDRREGHGMMLYANGDVYEGDWKDNRPVA
jgi:hypothetical protein